MGKPITSQRRGKGSSVYRSPSYRHIGALRYRKMDEKETNGVVKAEITDIIHAPGKGSPIFQVAMETRERTLMLGTEGKSVGDKIELGSKAKISLGNVLPLKDIPEGTPICNMENFPGDGGKLIRSSGSYGLLISHERDKVVVQMPSGRIKTIDKRARATIGVVAGGGRKTKPILKGGKMHHIIGPKAKYWPIVRKVRMNSINHPYGGNSGAPGRPTTVSRNAPPGRKVGLISARRTGRK